jgi:hypothetical protein
MNTILNNLSEADKNKSFLTIYKDGADFDIKLSDFSSAISAGSLKLLNGINLSASLTEVTDGIGTISPLQLSTTQVAMLGATFFGASSASTNILTLQSTTRNQFKVPSGSTTEFWYSASAEGMRMDANGNLAIGTTALSARLHVRGDGTNPIARFESSVGIQSLTINNAGETFNYGSGGNIMYIVNQNGSSTINGKALAWASNIDNLAGYGFRFFGFNNHSYTSGTGGLLDIGTNGGTFSASAGSGNFRPLSLSYTINNSGAQTGNATGLYLNATETALNGMTHNLMNLQVGGVNKFVVKNTGEVISANNISATSGGYLGWEARSAMRSVTDGRIILYNFALSGFDLLQLGGTTSSFPAIKRNGTAIDFRLADDSNYCDVNGKGFQGTYFYIGSTYYESARIYIGATTNAKLQPFTSGFSIEQGISSAINASAIFQLNSTTQGFLPPRMTTAQVNAIVTPAEGLVVFNTTISHLCVYQAGVWVRLNHSPM